MKSVVTEKGVVVPRSMLEGVREVDIRKRGQTIVITPVAPEDPISRIGKNPVKGGLPDASVNTDEHIYNGK